MNPPNRLAVRLVFVLAILTFAAPVFAQEVFTSYEYRITATDADKAPELGGIPRVNFPEEARKNAVEGTLVVDMTLDSDGKISKYEFVNSLPHGLEEAVKTAFQTFNFKPALRDGKPIACKMRLDYTITMAFDSNDSAVKKPKVTTMPDAEYPASELADKRKGEVTVGILFNKDGTVQILGVASSMPKPFDKAALDAAQNIKFTPGTLKKTKAPVSVKMNVVFKFKP